MSHPYKAAAHKNDPKWVKGLETPAVHNEFVQKDFKAAVRDRTVNPKVAAQASYAKKGK